MSREYLLPQKIYDTFTEGGIELICYESTDSTNRRAREYAEGREVCRPVLFVADSQTDGRGRLGRSFYSPSDTGLYMTLLIPAPENDLFTSLTAITAVVVRRAIYRAMDVSPHIKWVNDLYLDGRKVSGILAESFISDDRCYVALGIGINMTTREFPVDIASVAGALKSDGYESGEEARAHRLALAFLISRGLIEALGGGDKDAYMEEYRAASCVIGRDIEFTVGGETMSGRAVDITADGALRVMAADGERLLCSGEISVRVREDNR